MNVCTHLAARRETTRTGHDRHAFFRRRRDKDLTAEFDDRLLDEFREDAGRDPEPRAGIIDAQSVKGAASVPAAARGSTAGRRSTAASGTSWWTPSDGCWPLR